MDKFDDDDATTRSYYRDDIDGTTGHNVRIQGGEQGFVSWR